MKMIKAMIAAVLLIVSAPLYAGQVDINSADAKTLASELKGIGAKKAQAIVDYRASHGPFSSLDELEKVKGISEKIILNNREFIQLGKN